jgi:prepilin-type N-terminal cleavage/methylation domain-containing protein
MSNRRGFTMVEVMVALILTLAVGGVTYGLLVTNQRVSRSQTEHVGMQDNVRSGALIIANELREVGYDSVPGIVQATLGGTAATNSDLLLMEAGRLQYRAWRGIGFTCFAPAAGQLRIQTSAGAYVGVRQPQLNDSVAVYVENNNTTDTDDSWVHAKITGVPAASTCSDGVTAALTLPITYEAGTNSGPVTAGMIQGGPVRVYEAMEMRHYQSGTQWWLGMRSLNGGGAIEPVLGPLADSTAAQSGLVFRYLDKDRNVTAVPRNVREIEVALRGVSDGAVRTSGGDTSLKVDTLSLTTNVALRNTLRP